MKCSLHVVTAPVIVLALRQMFMGTAVSPEKMALVWGLICPQFSVGAAAFASGVGSGVGSGAAGSGRCGDSRGSGSCRSERRTGNGPGRGCCQWQRRPVRICRSFGGSERKHGSS